MFIGRGDVFGQWTVNWDYTWDKLKEAPVLTPKGIQIMLKVRCDLNSMKRQQYECC